LLEAEEVLWEVPAHLAAEMGPEEGLVLTPRVQSKWEVGAMLLVSHNSLAAREKGSAQKRVVVAHR
jgi:hypothetical protein